MRDIVETIQREQLLLVSDERKGRPHRAGRARHREDGSVAEFAASDECGKIDLWIPDGGALAGISSVSGGAGRPVSVARITVDGLGLTG